jgi:head-tail adaptor
MPRSLMHPKGPARLTQQFFDANVLVQQRTTIQDAWGQPTETWADVPPYFAVPCRISAIGGLVEERKLSFAIPTEANRVLYLEGDHADVLTTAMRLVATDGLTYDVLSVERDSTGSFTRVYARTVVL